ncbi:MAG: ubiquinol-cytochrome c reductase iron-sulfur subunit [Legionellaceae bacterium]|nr:ubiquinol-cytochrome c reductase iron-sulfur subunit [Legionellaceae bacterium]
MFLRKKAKTQTIKTQDNKVDESRREFLLNGIKLLGSLSAILAITPFVSSLNPSKKILTENAPVTVDLSSLLPGQKMTVQWRGKPIWILHRNQAMLNKININESQLRDPDSKVDQQPGYARNKYRAISPKYLVLVGLCTHLGCSPKLQSQDKKSEPDGFYCPCHGSRFDLAGRVYKGVPAPINLEVPPHRFISEDVLEIGEV